MNERTRERVSEWDSEPFSGGYESLHALADESFSGAAVTGGTYLFMLNGRVVGVHDGSMSDFEGASGTVYDAPHPSLPLLFSMLETGGETQGTYYTNDTPLSETNATLSDANFTGYVELSENVLSGDYYTVYYGGRSMSAAFVGTNDDLVTGDEAFERADDEVGLYEVVKVGVDILDIPEVEDEDDATGVDTAGTAADAVGGTAAAADAAGTGEASASPSPREDASVEPTESAETSTADDVTTATSSTDISEEQTSNADSADSGVDEHAVTDDATARAEAEREPEPTGSDRSDSTPEPVEVEAAEPERGAVPDRGTAEPETSGGESSVAEDTPTTEEAGDSGASAVESAASTTAETTIEDAEADGDTSDDAEESAVRPGPSAPGKEPVSEGPTARAVEPTDEEAVEREPSNERPRRRSNAKPGETASQSVDERFEEEAQWRSTRAVPAIDPDRSASSSDPAARKTAERRRREQTHEGRGSRQERARGQQSEESAEPSREELVERARERIGTLERAVEERDERIDSLEDELAAAGDAERVAELENALATARERAEAAEAADQDIAAVRSELEEAHAAREEAQSTLESVRAERDRLEERAAELESRLADVGVADSERSMEPEEVLAGTNLFVRYGSKADATLDAVGDTEPETINENLTLEHHTQFEAEGVTVGGEEFEAFLESTPEFRFVSWVVRDLPYEILDTGHRKSLGDVFEVVPDIDRAELHGSVTVEDEEGTEHVESFDVVVRDRMGNPLLVADLNTSRDPVRGEEMEELVSSAGHVAEFGDLGGAFYVTSSFFEPGALEAASAATDAGGLLSRSDKESYVKVARKNGFHLCLVEDRNGTFHLTVPEL